MAKKSTGKRDLIKPNGDARFVRRKKGKFSESDDVGRSLKADRRQKATKKVAPGYGDRTCREYSPRDISDRAGIA